MRKVYLYQPHKSLRPKPMRASSIAKILLKSLSSYMYLSQNPFKSRFFSKIATEKSKKRQKLINGSGPSLRGDPGFQFSQNRLL